MRLGYAGAAALTVLAAWAATGPAQAMAQRLPTSVVPSHYAVTWTPDLEAARFTGTEQIDVTVADGTRRIILNALDLQIQNARVLQGGTAQAARVSLIRPHSRRRSSWTVRSGPAPRRSRSASAGS